MHASWAIARGILFYALFIDTANKFHYNITQALAFQFLIVSAFIDSVSVCREIGF